MFQIVLRPTAAAVLLFLLCNSISCSRVNSLSLGGCAQFVLPSSSVVHCYTSNPFSLRVRRAPFLKSWRTISYQQVASIRVAGSIISRSSSSGPEEESSSSGIDLNDNPALYRVRISRRTGIEWGTDLSFSFVYVRALEPAGAADLTGRIQKGHQICELRPVVGDSSDDVSIEPINLIGASFDTVMTSFALLDKRVSEVDLVFFRGTKEELIQVCKGGSIDDDDEITITVNVNKKSGDDSNNNNKDNSNQQIIFKAKKGVNVRKLLTDNGINVYQSLTRWTNCKGKQLCGTCIVNISEGAENTNRKSVDEGSTLRENPESYRLSCVTFAYGDVTVDTFPPVNAAQWTR